MNERHSPREPRDRLEESIRHALELTGPAEAEHGPTDDDETPRAA